ncbi:MAG: nucleoside hydrolase [Tepidisphaerales bacterium]
MSERMAVLLDTDPGSDIDDVVALAYLLVERRCELVGVTTVSGPTEQRAGIVDVVLRAAGRTDVPVYAGLHGPVCGGPGQPQVPQYAAVKDLPHRKDFRRGEAIDFLRETIRRRPGELTLLTIGPLTNIAALRLIDPEAAGMLRQVVTMGGRYFPPAGWLADGQWSEWNIRCDPIAAKMVYDARLPGHVSYGLDVTERCALPAAEVRRRFEGHPLLRSLLPMAEVWFQKSEKLTFHDPLAAAAVFDPGLCTYETGTVCLEPSAWEHAGARTYFIRELAGGGPHRVARTVSAEAFFERYFGVFGD